MLNYAALVLSIGMINSGSRASQGIAGPVYAGAVSVHVMMMMMANNLLCCDHGHGLPQSVSCSVVRIQNFASQHEFVIFVSNSAHGT